MQWIWRCAQIWRDIKAEIKAEIMDNTIIIQRRNWIIITIKSNDKMIKDKAEIKHRRK
jgi:hypothetical protein